MTNWTGSNVFGKINAYYPNYQTGCEPIHEVRDWAYVRRIVRALKNGQEIPAIVKDGNVLLNGTHRAAANDLIMRLQDDFRDKWDDVPFVEVVDIDSIEVSDNLQEAIDNSDYETIDYILDRQN